ncbi:hypothetical protein V8C42DRAFT_358069 [Trichoderma barbatum]
MADQDDYSDIPKEVPLEDDFRADPENVARGHKATIANSQVSKEAKDHSRSVLQDEFQEDPTPEGESSTDTQSASEKNPDNVARGLKASISNEGVSAEAKEHAKQKLQEMDNK